MARRPRNVGIQHTLPTIHENEPLFHVERPEAGGVAVRGATTLARKVGRKSCKRHFRPTLPTIYEGSDGALSPELTPQLPRLGDERSGT